MARMGLRRAKRDQDLSWDEIGDMIDRGEEVQPIMELPGGAQIGHSPSTYGGQQVRFGVTAWSVSWGAAASVSTQPGTRLAEVDA